MGTTFTEERALPAVEEPSQGQDVPPLAIPQTPDPHPCTRGARAGAGEQNVAEILARSVVVRDGTWDKTEALMRVLLTTFSPYTGRLSRRL